MNILWIMADELRPSALGCYGGGLGPVATPHIDRLAAEGMRFASHWCNSPACVPSRVSMLTARLPEATGVYSNEGAWQSYPLPVRHMTFPEYFARHGYVTASFGKEHLPAGYAPWQTDEHDGSGMDVFTKAAPGTDMRAILPAGIPSPVGGGFPDDIPYPPEVVTRNAIDWLRHAPDRPFLLRVSYLQPHTPVLPPDRYRRRFRPEEFPGHDLPRGHGSIFEESFAEMVGGRLLTDAQMRQAQADYQALVSWLDDQVGLVLAALQASGRARDTVVIFNSDHGASLGENGLFGKVVFAPWSQQLPFIIRRPGGTGAGELCEDLSEALDLARTLCGLAGIAPDPDWAGRDLFGDAAPAHVLASIGMGSPGSRASSAANRGTWPDGSGWPRRACLRTARWRFDMNVRQDGKRVAAANEDAYLADRTSDPMEIRNLAADPAHADLIAGFRQVLLAQAEQSIEPAFVPAFSAAEVGDFAPPKF